MTRVASSGRLLATAALCGVLLCVPARAVASDRSEVNAADSRPSAPSTQTAHPSPDSGRPLVVTGTSREDDGGPAGARSFEVADGVRIAAPAGMPLVLIGLVFVFLQLEDAFDRRDPKLARAPMYGDPRVRFPDQDSVISVDTRWWQGGRHG